MTAGFTQYRTVIAEGARIGFVSCLGCGCAVLLDPDDEEDLAAIHRVVCPGRGRASGVHIEYHPSELF